MRSAVRWLRTTAAACRCPWCPNHTHQITNTLICSKWNLKVFVTFRFYYYDIFPRESLQCFPLCSHALCIDPLQSRRTADTGWSLQSAVMLTLSYDVLACFSLAVACFYHSRSSAVHGSFQVSVGGRGRKVRMLKMDCALSSWAFISI